MMFNSLYAKFAIILIVIFAITGVSFSVLSLLISQDYLQQINQQTHRDLAHNIVQQRHIINNNKVDKKALKDTFTHYMTVNPNLEFYLLDDRGNIQTFSAEPGQVKRFKVNLDAVKRHIDSDKNTLVKGDDPRSLSGKKLFSIAPIPNRNSPQGYLYIILQSQAVEKIYQDLFDLELFKYIIYSLIVSLIIGLILGLGLFYPTAQRLKKLALNILHYKETGFTEQMTIPATIKAENADEIELLNQNFYQMAEHISQQMLQLKKQDKLRRSMIANISHDLRTPLAAILGYLEVLSLKGEKLEQQKQKQYIKTALRSSQQLSRLIEDLFELAKLEASETPPHIEAFSIAELVLDVMDKFRLRAAKKNTSITIKCRKDMPFVYADISLIERALNNLIGNAVDHNEQNSAVKILLEKKNDSLQITIKDNGKGISKEHLSRIFDQFYQVDNQHRGGHAGLGLGITKRIIELHGQAIAVKSQPGRGTAFSFSLPTCNVYPSSASAI